MTATPPTERPVDELAAYAYVLGVVNSADADDLDAVYGMCLLLPDGRTVPVGDWTPADLTAVRRHLGLPNRPLPNRTPLSGARR